MTQDTTSSEEETTQEETSEEQEQENGSEEGLLGRVRERLSSDDDDDEEGGDGEDQGISKKLRLHIKLAQDVAVPRSVAYNQWTQLEDLPQFMKGVQSVELDDDDDDPGNITNSNWTVKIGITRRQFSAEVTEAIPDERIAWQATGGCEHKGVVSFATLDDDDHLTRVQVQMEYIPGDFIEKIGNIFLAARRKARKDLRLFKHYIELAGEETGAWRGEIPPPEESEEAEEAEDEQEEDVEEVEEPAAEASEEQAEEQAEETDEEQAEEQAEETDEEQAEETDETDEEQAEETDEETSGGSGESSEETEESTGSGS